MGRPQQDLASALLLATQGVPMVVMGEYGHSKGGNNKHIHSYLRNVRSWSLPEKLSLPSRAWGAAPLRHGHALSLKRQRKFLINQISHQKRRKRR